MPDPALVVVGHCTSTSATVFCCSPAGFPAGGVARLAWRAGKKSGKVEVSLDEAAPYHTALFRLKGLPEGAKVEYGVDLAGASSALRAPGTLLETPRSFRLLPAGRPLRVALVSCNGGYKMSDEARRHLLWRRLREEIEAGQVDVVVHGGDQIYADSIWVENDTAPRGAGLHPGDRARVAELTAKYRDKYVTTWSNPEIAAVLAAAPNLMTWDDHDIYDGYGSHDDDDQPPQQAFLAAAKQAFSEFQASHGPGPVHPESFLTGFAHEGVGIVLLDTRGNRMWERQRVLGQEQIAALKAWCDANAAGLRRLYVVSSIPLVHARVNAALAVMRIKPGTESEEDDLRDSWTASNNRNECQSLLKSLFTLQAANPGLQVTLLSGDVHVAALGEIRSQLPAHRAPSAGSKAASKPRIFQITSSGIASEPPSGFALWLIRQATRGTMTMGTPDVLGRLIPMNGSSDLVLARRNFVVLSLEGTEEGTWDPYGNLYAHYHVENRRGNACDVLPQVLNGPGSVND